MENENINQQVTENVPSPVEPTPPAPETPVAESVTAPTPEQPPAPETASPQARSQPINLPTPLNQDLTGQAPIISAPSGLAGLLMRAKEKIQFRKRAKLEKIVSLAQSKGKVTNDNVQKLLHCSDATATRYLAELVKRGRLRRVGPAKQPFYVN